MTRHSFSVFGCRRVPGAAPEIVFLFTHTAATDAVVISVCPDDFDDFHYLMIAPTPYGVERGWMGPPVVNLD